MRLHSRVIAGLVAAFALTTAAAQTGAIRVKVIDASDKSPLPGVTVVLRNSMQYVPTTTVLSNRDGFAEFPVLRAGSGYSVEVSFPGYAKQIQTNLKVPINEVLQVGFALSPEMVEREVVVGKRETVDLEKSSTSTKFGDDFIQDLPVQGRFYQSVLTMAAGVQDADGDGNPNVHGARSRDFKAQVDGVSNQDPLTGYQMSQVNPDSIEEIEVITAGAGVEFGRAQGGFANIIQKQGSNDFEGTFNFLYQSSLLDGGANSFAGAPKPEYEVLQPAIQVSGPILRDRLWYRLSHEYISQESPQVTYEGIATVTTSQHISSDAITWQVSPRNKLQFTYSADPLKVENWGVGLRVPASSSLTREFGGPVYRLNWTAPFSAKILFDSVFSFQDSSSKIMPTTTGVKNNCVVSGTDEATGAPDLPFIETAQCYDIATNQTSGSFYLTFNDHRQRFTVRSQANIFGGRFWGMDHQFKVGLSVENERYFREQTRLPTISFLRLTLANDEGTNPRRSALVLSRFAIPESVTTRGTGTATALYFEDMVKPRPNLSITLGIRLDREALNARGYSPFDVEAEEEAYYEARDALIQEAAQARLLVAPDSTYESAVQWVLESSDFSNIERDAMRDAFTGFEGSNDFAKALELASGVENISLKFGNLTKASTDWAQKRQADDVVLSNINIGPHLAVSWDPWSDGKTKLTFSARRLYGATPLTVPLSETEPAVTDVLLTAEEQETGVYRTTIGGGINPSVSVSVMDRGYTTPYTDELTFSIEREVWAETSLKLTYVAKDYINQIQDIDLNHYPADVGRCLLQSDPKLVPSWIELTFDNRGRPIGDGILDDCDGKLKAAPLEPAEDGTGDEGGGGGSSSVLHRPDGYLDTYSHNVGWGSIYLVSNFNSAEYRGWQLELTRRQYRNWQMNASYVYSRAVGDAEDWNSSLGDDRTSLEDEYGYLSYDQRHVLKVNATTITPWGFRLGTAVQWQTGLPYSLLREAYAQDSAPPTLLTLGSPDPRPRQRYTTGQRNDQRNRAYWNIDLKVDKEMNLGKGMNLQVAADIFNLLNDRTYVIWNPFEEQGVQTNGYNEAYRRSGRTYQLSAKLSF